ncbi:hypothetical protein [Paracoccus benzoatiresistens]|uniref:DUF3224 domain-containing protein n=1 Tax=Paracoccus benzoatiresistens TaxID=2997341 RepID=A0ABT4J0K4_9RHOB|nr:hypothetical protein [Paracoccus sp. EF6]MCZ0960162.1 hypothetical protein [Paracoccus sp. EF6]
MALAKIALAILTVGFLSPNAALAEEQILRFKLVITMTSDAKMELPSITEQSVTANEAVGVAYFEDGRIAFKQFALATVGGEKDGNWMGLSTYTFENGDALNLKFNGSWSPEGSQVEYTLLSGGGAFEGATGTGELTGIGTSWKEALLFEGSFTLQVPGT